MNGPLVSSIAVVASAVILLPLMVYLAAAHTVPAVAVPVALVAAIVAAVALVTVISLRDGRM